MTCVDGMQFIGKMTKNRNLILSFVCLCFFCRLFKYQRSVMEFNAFAHCTLQQVKNMNSRCTKWQLLMLPNWVPLNAHTIHERVDFVFWNEEEEKKRMEKPNAAKQYISNASNFDHFIYRLNRQASCRSHHHQPTHPCNFTRKTQ